MSGNDDQITLPHARPRTSDDLIIAWLADENADLREANRQLLALVADLAWDIERLRAFADLQYWARVARPARREAHAA